MKKILTSTLFCLLSFLTIHAAQKVETVSLEQVHEAITKNDPNVTIIDVRKSNEFAKSHIPGAINIPFDKYHKFQKKGTQYPGLKKNGTNLVYCYNAKCRLAEKACEAFTNEGFPSKEITGGYDSWKSKYPLQVAIDKR